MRKRTRRKVWSTAHNPVRCAVFAHKYSGDAIAMEIQELLTMDELKAGRLNADGVRFLEAFSAISRRLAKSGVGPEVEAVCNEADTHLAAFRRSGEVTPAMLHAMLELHAWHVAQREGADKATYAAAAAPYCHLTQ